MSDLTRHEQYLNHIADYDAPIPEPQTREEYLLREIADTVNEGGGGGSSLPAVTSDDNGDVLTVVEGAWAKAAPSGGSDLPSVTAADNGAVLEVLNGAWGKGSKGYSYELEILVPQQTVTASDMGGAYVAMLNDCVIPSKRFDKARVTFDGIEYEIDKTQIGFSPLYGRPPQNGVSLGDGTQMSPDLSDLPFFILISPDGSGMYVTTGGEHTIKAEALIISADDAFTEAVKSGGIWLDVVYDADAGEVRCTNQLTGETISPKDALIMIGNHDYKNISYNGNPAFVARASTSIDFVWASLSGNSVSWTGTRLASSLFA